MVKLDYMLKPQGRATRDTIGTMDLEVIVKETIGDVAQTAAALIVRILTESTGHCNITSLAVSGGSTPKHIFEIWQELNLPFLSNLHIFVSDERHVPLSHPDSNSGVLLSKWPNASKANLHIPTITADIHQDAVQYSRAIADVLGEEPVFDCLMLGLGEDGHTASLFPNQESLETVTLVTGANHGTPLPHVQRLTFTYPLINKARHVVLIACGASKRRWIERYLAGGCNVAEFPFSGVRPVGKLWFVLDSEACPEI